MVALAVKQEYEFEKINYSEGMKLSVVWAQLRSALLRDACHIAKYNGAFAKTFPDLKKRQFVDLWEATRDGKYIKFPDGSQARY